MNKKKGLELRCYNVEFRTTENDGELVGRPIIYNQETDLEYFREVIDEGSLNAENLKDVLLCINHNMKNIPLARSRNNNEKSTMQLIIDGEGLKFIAKLDVENNPEARAAYSSVERGDMDGMSFGFRVKRVSWEDIRSEKPLRRIKEFEIVKEVSIVNFPQYTQTEIDVKRNKEILDEARSNDSLELDTRNRDDLELEKLKFKVLHGN